MDTAAAIALRPSSSRSFFASSLRCHSSNLAFPDSIHLRGILCRGNSQTRFPFLAVNAQVPTTTNDSLQESPLSTHVSKENTLKTENREQDEVSKEGHDKIKDDNMSRVCDKLIEVFLVDKPTPSDWRKLLAFSRTWSETRLHFYARCQNRADAESDPTMKLKLLKLSRKLKEVDDDVTRHNELLEVVQKDRDQIVSVVAKRRKDFTEEFFVHLGVVAESYFENPEKRRDMFNLGKACLVAMNSYDDASGNIEDLNEDELNFDDLMNSPRLDFASKKIDDIATRKQLDSSIFMTSTKAWSDGKETDLNKEEVMDMMFHDYKDSLRSIYKMVPKEVRILKYILTIRDPKEVLEVLNDAFTPCFEHETEDDEYLWTTPKELLHLVKTIVVAFHYKQRNMVTREARDLLRPNIVKYLEKLKKIIESNFLVDKRLLL